MRRLQVEFKERQLGCFGYTTSFNACLDYLHDGLFETLDCCRQHYGSFLDGVCGDSFRVFYSRANRMDGTFCYPFNPLKICAESLGYEHEHTYGEDEHEAVRRLKTHIDEGRPVIVPLVLPPPEWVLVVGYDQLRFYLHTFAGMKTYTEEKFRESYSSSWWHPTLDPDTPKAPHPMFVLKQRGPRRDAPMLIIESLKRGVELMKVETFSWDGQEYCGGFRALEERARDLEEDRDWDNLEDKEEDLVNWGFYPLLYYQLSRWSRTGFLSISMKQFREVDSEKLRNALRHTEKVNSLVKIYRETLSVPWPNSPRNSGALIREKLKERERRERGASILREIAYCEMQTVREIETLIT